MRHTSHACIRNLFAEASAPPGLLAPSYAIDFYARDCLVAITVAMAITKEQARGLNGLSLCMPMPMGLSKVKNQKFKHGRNRFRATEFKKEGDMKVLAQEPIEFQMVEVATLVPKLHRWFQLSHRLLTRDTFCCWWRESRIPYRCHPRIKISGPSLPRHSGVYLTSLELLPRVAPKLSESFDIRFLKALYDGPFTSMPFSIGLLRVCVQRVQPSKDLVMFPIYCRLGWLEFTNECQILHVREDFVD